MKRLDWLKLTLLVLLFLVLILSIVSCEPAAYFPEEGIWYCRELQIQISGDRPVDCWIISEGEKIQCTWGSDRGSKWMSVGCQDPKTERYHMGEVVFGGEFVSLDDNALMILEPVSNKEHTFIRVEESE